MARKFLRLLENLRSWLRNALPARARKSRVWVTRDREREPIRHALAFGNAVPVEAGKLDNPGYFRFRRGGELHAVSPPVIQNFHTFVGIKGADKAGKAEDYKKYVEAVLTNRPHSLRNLLELVPLSSGPVSIDEVEPIEEIRRRFTLPGCPWEH